jgi:hypothetical protein
VSPQSVQRISAIDEGIGMIRPQGDGAVVIPERIAETLQPVERDTAVDQRLDEIRPHRQRAIGVGKRGVVAANGAVDDGQEIQSGCRIRVGG